MDKTLQGQVAVVTGAGRGIGREIALELARRGARVAALARSRDQLDETVAAIAAEGGQGLAVPVDLVDLPAVEAALAPLGQVDLLVNNHGSFRAFGPIWEVDPAEWWGDVEINLRGSFHTARVLAPGMIARGRGRIVNLVGGGTGGSFPNGSGYAASKAGLMRWTECLNDTLGGAVRAFALDPGLVRTAMTELQVTSAAGQAWLPGIQTLFDEGVNVPPSRAAGVVAAIAEGRFDALAGRMLRGVDDLTALEAEIPGILARDLRSLRLTGIEPPKL